MKLTTQFAVVSGALIAILFASMAFFQANTLHNVLDQRQYDWSKSLTAALAESLARDIINGNQIGIRGVLVNITAANQEIEYAYVTGFNGEIIAHTFANGFPEKLLHNTSDNNLQQSLQRTVQLDGKPLIDTTFPIIEGMRAQLHLGIDPAPNELVYSHTLVKIITVFFLLAGIGIFISILLARHLIQPINNLAENLRNYDMDSGATLPVPDHAGMEVRRLYQSFREMSSILARRTATLRANEEQLRLVIEGSSDGVWDWNPQTHEDYLSPRWKEIVGYRDDELANIDSTFFDLIHPNDKPAVTEAVRRHFENNEPFHVEMRLRHKDGSYRWVLSRGEAQRDTQGQVVRMVGSITDITEQKHIAEQLHQFKSTLDQTTDCVFMFDPITLRFTYANQGALNQVGYPHTALMSMTPVDIKPDYDEATFRALLTPLLTNRQSSLIFETRHQHKDGHILPVEIFLQYVAPAGEPARFVAIVRDITERKKITDELERHREHLADLVLSRTADLENAKNDAVRANHAKNDFLSRMSHELRTPMNAILGFSQVLQLEQLHPEQHDFVMEIDRAGTHLLQLINELLDVSRIESGKMTILIQTVNLSQVVLDSIKLVESLLAEKRLSLRNNCDARAMVLADPIRLKQIIVNLLSNAAKYNRACGSIVLACQVLSETQLRLSVTDTGPGIAPEKMTKLFTLFERLGAENSAVDGTGIGLALSRQLAGLMNAELGVDSTPGIGTTFWLDLNIAPNAAQISDKAHTTSASSVTDQSAKYKILYVEDNAANLRVVEAMFRHQPNMTLLSATNGEYGLQLAHRYQPDVIMLDIHLPGMDGYAVLQALLADPATRHIPIIALSADAMPLDIERGLQAGFQAYLTKPVKLNELLNLLNKALRREEKH